MGHGLLTHKHTHTSCGWVVHDRRPRRHVLSAERSQPLFRKTTMLRPPHSQTHCLTARLAAGQADWLTYWLTQSIMDFWWTKILKLPTEWLTGGKSNWHASLWQCRAASTDYFHSWLICWLCLLINQLVSLQNVKNSDKCTLQFPRAQGDVFKHIVLSSQQSKSQRHSINRLIDK